MKNLLQRLASLLALVTISGCQLSPPNVEVITRLNNGAFGSYTISGPETRYNEASWGKMEVGLFCLRPEGFGEVKKFIIEACERSKNCNLSKDEVENISGFME